jgi:hypothetical protein
MARNAPGHDENGIDSEVVARADEAGGERLGGGGDSAEAVMVERESGFDVGSTRFHLHERHDSTPFRHEIDLADRRPGAAGEDTPSLHLEPDGRETLGASAAAFGTLPLHLSVSARS